MGENNKTTLFYTCVNTKFWGFGMIYPMFVLLTNPNSLVEIGVENGSRFKRKYKHVIEFYEQNFPNRVKFSPTSFYKWGLLGRTKIVPNTVRFVTKPSLKADYLYIGDSDIFITEEITSQHVKNINDNGLDFSNMVRGSKRRLTGLHFIEYDKMYPLPSLLGLRLGKKNDEEILFELMARKGYKMPSQEVNFRPAHGLHISMYSSSPFEYVATPDKVVDFPAWFMDINSRHNMGKQDMLQDVDKYFALRNSPKFIDFLNILTHKEDVEMRRIMQITDACAFYYKNVIAKGLENNGKV